MCALCPMHGSNHSKSNNPNVNDDTSTTIPYVPYKLNEGTTQKNGSKSYMKTNFIVPKDGNGFRGLIMTIHLGKMYTKSNANKALRARFYRFNCSFYHNKIT